MFFKVCNVVKILTVLLQASLYVSESLHTLTFITEALHLGTNVQLSACIV